MIQKFPYYTRIISLLGLKPFMHHFSPWLMVISNAVSSVLIFQLSQTFWMICFLTTVHVTVNDYPEGASLAALVSLVWIIPSIHKVFSGSYSYCHMEQSFFIIFSSLHALWPQQLDQRFLFLCILLSSFTLASITNIDIFMI